MGQRLELYTERTFGILRVKIVRALKMIEQLHSCRSFQYARCGDEMFLQTLVMNSKFKESLHQLKMIETNCLIHFVLSIQYKSVHIQ